MENRMTARVFCLLAAFLGGCGDVGIFKAINAETKLNSDPSAPGNILSIVRYSGALYAAGGRIYRKDTYTKEGGWSKNSKPEGLVVRLAVGYSKDDGKEYLYALTAKTDSKGTTAYELWYTSGEAENWKWVSMRKEERISTEKPPPLFSNYAASAEEPTEENKESRAYITTSDGVFELAAGTIKKPAIEGNNASPSSVAAAYANGTTYFADTAAFASDGEHLFQGDGTKISYGTATPLNPAVEVEGINNTIMSLWAHKTGESTGTLYIGTASGIKTVPYNTATGAPEPYNPDTGKTEATSPGNATSTALGNCEVPAVFATTESNEDGTAKAVYASTVGTTATQGTKKNGLWGYYPGRDTWDWE